ncbi:MAG: hypothetical protein L6V81_06260 [Clostridium sp.]|nr:MAG: hypothetical protein L6V81_06260 [Clostridium sp.]
MYHYKDKKRPTDSQSRYIFSTIDEFEKNISQGRLLEYQTYRNNYYGTLRDSYEEIVNNGNIAITDMECNGINSLKKKFECCFKYFN